MRRKPIETSQVHLLLSALWSVSILLAPQREKVRSFSYGLDTNKYAQPLLLGTGQTRQFVGGPEWWAAGCEAGWSHTGWGSGSCSQEVTDSCWRMMETDPALASCSHTPWTQEERASSPPCAVRAVCFLCRLSPDWSVWTHWMLQSWGKGWPMSQVVT